MSERTILAEGEVLVDWQKAPIWENTAFTTIFNYEKQALILSEEQIAYCLNLIRYCHATEFEKNNNKKL